MIFVVAPDSFKGGLTSKNVCDVVEQALLERQLLRVQMLLDAGTPPVVAVTWFQPDAKKQGGAYVTAKGKVRKIDEFGGALLLVGGEKIPISAVIGIQLYNDKEQIEEG